MALRPTQEKGSTMSWTWSRATGEDITPIMLLAKNHFETEADSVFTIDELEYSRNVGLAVVSQFYNPYTELIMVAKDQGQIVAYCWAKRNERAAWSTDEMVAIRIAHVNMTLPARDRVQLVKGMIMLWETWATECGVPIICSTTMRRSQDGFLKIHQRMGYDVRGSIAYKRLN